MVSCILEAKARRALIMVAAGVGQGPEPVVKVPKNIHNPVGVEHLLLFFISCVFVLFRVLRKFFSDS